MSGRKILAVLICALALGLLAGCGGSESRQASLSDARPTTGRGTADDGSLAEPEALPPATLRRLNCRWGQISLGEGPGAVDFEAECFARKEGAETGFIVVPHIEDPESEVKSRPPGPASGCFRPS